MRLLLQSLERFFSSNEKWLISTNISDTSREAKDALHRWLKQCAECVESHLDRGKSFWSHQSSCFHQPSIIVQEWQPFLITDDVMIIMEVRHTRCSRASFDPIFLCFSFSGKIWCGQCTLSFFSDVRWFIPVSRLSDRHAFLVHFQNAALVLVVSETTHDGPTNAFDCLRVTRVKFDSSRQSEYCRRPADPVIYQKPEFCHGGDDYYSSFKNLKRTNMTAYRLTKSGILIDVIDAYIIYLETGKGQDEIICTCTWNYKPQFGARCEYMFPFSHDPFLIGNNIFGSFLTELELEISREKVRQRDVNNGTCYADLPGCVTQTGLCLHWNQICDG